MLDERVPWLAPSKTPKLRASPDQPLVSLLILVKPAPISIQGWPSHFLCDLSCITE